MRMMQVTDCRTKGKTIGYNIPAGAYRIVEVGPDSAWFEEGDTSEKIGQIVIPCQMFLWDDGWVGFDSNETSVHQCKLEPLYD